MQVYEKNYLNLVFIVEKSIILNVFFYFLSYDSDSSISTRVDMLTTPVSCGQTTPGMWQKDDTLENFGMKPSTSGLWREANLIDIDDDDDNWEINTLNSL